MKRFLPDVDEVDEENLLEDVTEEGGVVVSPSQEPVSKFATTAT